jgi:hypothetical protein
MATSVSNRAACAPCTTSSQPLDAVGADERSNLFFTAQNLSTTGNNRLNFHGAGYGASGAAVTLIARGARGTEKRYLLVFDDISDMVVRPALARAWGEVAPPRARSESATPSSCRPSKMIKRAAGSAGAADQVGGTVLTRWAP